MNYQHTVPGKNFYKGMSGGAVLNERRQLVGIHVGLVKKDGDRDGVLISTLLRDIPEEVSRVLARGTPVASSSSTRANEEVKLQQQLEEERRKREEADKGLEGFG
ncbi:MAG: hypothetical protein F6K17_21550 [Okeania sp. SIO3C4]|nr:hypothetical protein [Okeania sp. SIO3B3]NER04993.1 hypothetical protein [Okeania sp. SIO3C4]